MSFGDDLEAFKIVLDRLIESEKERSKYAGVNDIINKEIARVVDESRRPQRLINDRQDLSSVNSLLKDIRPGFVADSELERALLARIDAAIELTEPIPF